MSATYEIHDTGRWVTFFEDGQRAGALGVGDLEWMHRAGRLHICPTLFRCRYRIEMAVAIRIAHDEMIDRGLIS